MKRINSIIFCLIAACMVAMAQEPVTTLTRAQHLQDYDIAVKYVEDNYSGFSFWVADSTRADYEETKARLRSEVERGERPCWDAIAAYTGWFNDLHLHLVVSYNGLKSHTYHKRHFISYSSLMEEYAPQPVACKVTDKSFLIRFPSCMGNPGIKWIKESIKQYKKSHCKNLIIDIRGNTGGNDGYFNPYMELLCDHDTIRRGLEFRNTPQNIECLKQWGSFPNVIKLAAEKPDDEFIALGHQVVKKKKVNQSVKRAALIIDNNVASSGEGITNSVRARSHKTTIYGRDNTLGAIDFANLSSLKLPNCNLTLHVPMSRSAGLPETSTDMTGIAPDVRIDLPLPKRLTDNVDEWVIWIAEQLEKE